MNDYVKMLLLVIVAVGAFFFGRGVGINEQKVADQKIFDQTNTDIADWKAKANDKYRRLVLEKIAGIVANENLISAGDKRYEEGIKAADSRRAKYAGNGLRFATTEGPGLRSCGNGPGSASAETNTTGPAYVELPGQIREGLRGLQLDGDRLIEAYRKAFDWINQMKCPGASPGTSDG